MAYSEALSNMLHMSIVLFTISSQCACESLKSSDLSVYHSNWRRLYLGLFTAQVSVVYKHCPGGTTTSQSMKSC